MGGGGIPLIVFVVFAPLVWPQLEKNPTTERNLYFSSRERHLGTTRRLHSHFSWSVAVVSHWHNRAAIYYVQWAVTYVEVACTREGGGYVL